MPLSGGPTYRILAIGREKLIKLVLIPGTCTVNCFWNSIFLFYKSNHFHPKQLNRQNEFRYSLTVEMGGETQIQSAKFSSYSGIHWPHQIECRVGQEM